MRLLSSRALVLIAVALFNHGSASAVELQDTANAAGPTGEHPLTRRATPCAHGKIADFDCENVELLAYLPASALGGATDYDIWGWSDSATGREFVAIGSPPGTAFVEVTDPVNPKYLGRLLPRDGVNPSAQSVKVYRNYAFIGYEGVNYGMQIFDLTQLREAKAPVEFQETAHYDGVGNIHTIAVNSATGFAYLNGSNTCGGGLHMIDVRTPTKPTFVGCYTETNTGRAGTGYVHDTQCVIYRGPDRQYKGREICVNYAETGISIADVTDKKHPKTISIASYPNVGYTHQGWFTEDQRYIFVGDEGDESATAQQVGRDQTRTRTIGFDLTDLDEPVVLTEYFNPTTPNTDHNLYIHGRYMYQANYGAGLRILDVVDPKNPKQVGSLTMERVSAWGTYPFLKNNVVAVSTDGGLWLARLLAR